MKFLKKNLALQLKNSLALCGLVNQDIGVTFVVDHMQKNGTIAGNALDHVYLSGSITKE